VLPYIFKLEISQKSADPFPKPLPATLTLLLGFFPFKPVDALINSFFFGLTSSSYSNSKLSSSSSYPIYTLGLFLPAYLSFKPPLPLPAY